MRLARREWQHALPTLNIFHIGDRQWGIAMSDFFTGEQVASHATAELNRHLKQLVATNARGQVTYINGRFDLLPGSADPGVVEGLRPLIEDWIGSRYREIDGEDRFERISF